MHSVHKIWDIATDVVYMSVCIIVSVGDVFYVHRFSHM